MCYKEYWAKIKNQYNENEAYADKLLQMKGKVQ